MPRILLVDDDTDFFFLIQTVLGRHGIEVTQAKDGNEALSAVSSNKPDGIIMDKVMPGMDGFEVARRIRQEPRFANLPILIVSGAANLDDKLEAFDAGADDYLTKPFDIDELAARINALLEQAEAKKAARAEEIAAADDATVLAVHTLRGGLGSSSVSINLSVAFTLLWRSPTLLLDMDMVNGQIALMRLYGGPGGVGLLSAADVAANFKTLVPEPTTMALLGLGALALVRRRRRN